MNSYVLVTVSLLLSSALSAMSGLEEQTSELVIEYSRARLLVRGDISSAGHEQILRQSAALEFPESDIQFELSIRTGLPPAWSLITDLTLRALAKTTSATAEITAERITIRGLSSDPAAWQDAVDWLEKTLSPEIVLDASVATLKSSRSFESVCRGLFAAAFRAHRIGFEGDSMTLSSSAYSLLDELIELGTDCPAALIRITGNGDGGGAANQETGRQRAEAVLSYLEGRGFDPARLSAHGAKTSTNRKIVFSVTF